jgi:HTH-type transcriptional regulator, cell division transcriptional repressor
MNGSATIFGRSNPGNSTQTLAQRIVEAREAIGLTTAQLAHRLGVRTATLASWEQGRGEPRTNRLMMLAGLLSVSPTWLLCGRGTAPHETGDADVDSLKTSLSELRSMISAMGEHVQTLEQRVESLNRNG